MVTKLEWRAQFTMRISRRRYQTFAPNILSHILTQNLETRVEMYMKEIEEELEHDVPEVFSGNIGHATTKSTKGYLNDADYRTAHGYILSNCELLRDYERYILLDSTHHLLNSNIILK